MSNFTRAALALGACAATAGLSACGNPAPSASATARPSGSSFASPPATGSPSPTVSALALTVADLPATGPALAQISDGRMNDTANTDQRGFANTTNTYRIEDDVLLDTSVQAASADYAQLLDAAKSQVMKITSSSNPGLGSQSDEFVGTSSSGYSEVGITFQEGDVIAVLLLVDSSGTVAGGYAEAVAQVQDQRIVAAAA